MGNISKFFVAAFVLGVYSQSALAGDKTQILCEATSEKQCVIENEIFASLTMSNRFVDTEHRFELYVNGLYESNMTLGEFLRSDYLQAVIPLGKENRGNVTSGVHKKAEILAKDSMVTTRDAPLRCQDDYDHSCEDWASNVATNALMYRLDNMQALSFTLTKQHIDSANNALDVAVNLILYHPSAKIVNYVTKLGNYVALSKTREAIIAVALSKAISAGSSGLITIKPGDVISVDGKGNIVISSAGNGSNSGGNGGSGGGGSGGGGSSGNSGGSITIPSTGGGGKVVIACTSSSGKTYCKPIIV